MRNKQLIEIGPLKFRTKADAAKYVQSILARYQVGQAIEGEDQEVVLDLLSRHPDAVKKIGVGVRELFVDIPEQGGKCFWLRRSDGSKTDFSYQKCLAPKPPHAKYMEACRNAVKDQINAKRDEVFATRDEIQCPLTGEMISRDKAHVDHTPPNEFRILAFEFARVEKFDPLEVELDGCGDGESEKRFHDRELERKWREFHRERAVLRVVSVWGNLSVSKLESHRLDRKGR